MSKELLIVFIAMVVIGSIFFIFTAIKTWKEALKEARELMFPERDLEVCNKYRLNRKTVLKTYNLKTIENSDELDREDYTYLLIASILNGHIKFEFDQENLDFNIELDDFRTDELEVLFTDILESVTNFRISQFRFKSEKNQRKIIGSDDPIIEKLKEHTDTIISVVFKDMIETYYGDKLQAILDQQISGK